MSIGRPPDEVCHLCGALVPQQKLPEGDGIPGQLVCGEERYQSRMIEHLRRCPGKPLDRESQERLGEIKKRLEQWVVVEEPESPKSKLEVVTILIQIPRSIHFDLLKKATDMGIPLEQYCVGILSRPLRDSTTK